MTAPQPNPELGPLDQAEAALIAHLELASDRGDGSTRSFVSSVVEAHVGLGSEPEVMVVALKRALRRVRWPAHVDGAGRRQSVGEMVDWSIDLYFARRSTQPRA